MITKQVCQLFTPKKKLQIESQIHMRAQVLFSAEHTSQTWNSRKKQNECEHSSPFINTW